MIYRINKLDVAEINRILELVQGGTSSSLSDLNVYIKGVESKLQFPTAYDGPDVNTMRGLLDAIDDDDLLTTKEKRVLIPMVDGFVADRTQLQPQAVNLGFIPANPDQYAIWTAYSNALDDLVGFLEAYGKNSVGTYKWRDVSEDLPLGTGNGVVLRHLREEYARTYAILRAAMWNVTFEIGITAELANSTAVQAAQDAPKVVNGLPTLPNTSYPTGKLVYDTVTKRLYRSTGSTWESATVASGDIVGQLTASQIHDITAAQISTQLSSDQIASIVASKISGQLTDSQIAAIAAAKLTGQITTTQITDNAITTGKISAGAVTAATIAADTITASQIAANAITASELATDSVTATKILAGSVNADKLAANSVTADKIISNAVTADKILAGAIGTDKLAANAVTAAKIAANTITANEIASDTITAGQIQAGAIGADELAAYSVYAKHLVVANFDNLIPNPSSELSSPSGAIDGAGVTYDTSAYSGNYLRRTSSGTNVSNNIPCAPGDQFIFQAWGRGACRLVIACINKDGNEFSWPLNDMTSGSWTQFSATTATGGVPAGTVAVRFRIESRSGNADFDGLYARRMADANLLVDGTISTLMLRVGNDIQSGYFSPGSTGNSAVGFKLSATPFSVQYRDGSTANDCLFELGGTASVNGYRIGDVTNKAFGGLLEYATAGSYNFTPQSGVKEVEITLQGGGGAGAGSYGGGGGAGQYIRRRVSVTPGTTYTIVVGGQASSSSAFGLTAAGGSNANATTGGNGTIGWASPSSSLSGGGINSDGQGSLYAIEDPERGWNICGSAGGGGGNSAEGENHIGGNGGSCGYMYGGNGAGLNNPSNPSLSKLGGGGGGASAMANGGTAGMEGSASSGSSGSFGSGGGGGSTGGAGGVGYARIRW